MSTMKYHVLPVGRRGKVAPKIRPVRTWSSAPNAPVARAWRCSGDLAAVECPFCGGLHIHGAVTASYSDTARTPSCPDAFREQRGDTYNLAMQGGRLPERFRRAIDKDLPLGDLPIAYHLIANEDVPSLDPRRSDWWRPGVWFWQSRHLIFALGVLRAVGYKAEAQELSGRLKPFRRRTFWQLGQDPRWWACSMGIKIDVLAALTAAWRSAGR